MISFVLRRLLQLAPVLLVASLLIWAMIYAVPGGPVSMIAGADAAPEQIEAVSRELGLDRPVLVQYADWIGNAFVGNLGESLHSKEPVAKLIGERLPASIQLALASLFFALLLGIPVAIVSALNPGTWLDRVLSAWSALAMGVPTFWMGILLILVFAVELRWLPSVSAYVPVWQDPLEAMRNLLLPSATLGIFISGIFARFLRASLVDELRADYVRTARAKGLPGRQIVGTHVMRNALIPFITVVGLMLASFLGGTLVTEVVFTYPGLGRLLTQAIASRDYPLIQGCVLVIIIFVMAMNLIVDMLYAYVDPRIEFD